jgi:methyl-accepting chemotaxis protein
MERENKWIIQVMRRLIPKSIWQKSAVLSSLNILVIGVLLILSSNFIQRAVITQSIAQQAEGVTSLWASTINPTDIQTAYHNTDIHSPIQTKIMSQLKQLAVGDSMVAQGYVLGSNLSHGNNLLIVVQPLNLIQEDPTTAPGNFYNAPDFFYQSFKTAVDQRKLTITPVYSDQFGTWVSVLDPIVNASGHTIAVFGVDFNASYINQAQYKLLTWEIPIFVLMSLIILSVQILGMRRVFKPLHYLFTAFEQMASGNMKVRLEVKSKDEFGELAQLFNSMVDNLRHLIHQVSISVSQVADSSEELMASAEQTSKATEHIAATAHEVAIGTEHQVKNIEESALTVNEMSSGIQQISTNAQGVSSRAIRASEVALQGNQGIQAVIGQMNFLNTTVNDLDGVVKGLGDRSQEIGQIVQVITDIAAQTNLLALNASIEAARAGEHGRGFAVVADEVRKLAEQSSESAKKITQLVTTIQLETSKAIHSMAKGTDEVTEGIKMVHVAGESFAQIYQAVNEVTQQAQAVSSATQQLTVGTEHIVNTINQVAAVAKSNSSGTQSVSASSEEQLASMEEINASSAALAKMAEQLQVIIGNFKV